MTKIHFADVVEGKLASLVAVDLGLLLWKDWVSLDTVDLHLQDQSL